MIGLKGFEGSFALTLLFSIVRLMYIDNRSVIVFLEMRSQTLLAQKPKRVGRLANVGTEVRNKNETAKLFSNFLSFKHHFP